MREKIKHWANVCKLHWKEIVTMSIALHWIVDLLIIIPLSALLGYLFGVHVGN